MAIELSAARAERRTFTKAISGAISGAVRGIAARFAGRASRGFHDHAERLRFERELEARRSLFREGGPW